MSRANRHAQAVRRCHVDYDAKLVEDTVMLTVSHRAEEFAYRKGRAGLYDIAEGEERERKFRALHAQWFTRLNLGHTVQAALDEQPVLAAESGICCVLRAVSRADEGADLHDLRKEPHPLGKAVVIRLRPAAFLDPATLRAFLRHELMHLVDILDPDFGYLPVFPKSQAGPTYDNLVRERYRAVWNTWIDGRLSARGWAPGEARESRLREFSATFCLGTEAAEAKFSRFFDAVQLTHQEILEFARNPSCDSLGDGRGGARFCPLCAFPSFHWVSRGDVSSEMEAAIAQDFPQWRPAQGLCRQCADLYRSCRMSRLAEAALPGR